MNQNKMISLFAVAASLCVVSSCGSGSSNNGGGDGTTNPETNLANPSDFKNTVTTQQLPGKLNQLSSLQGEIESQLNIPAQSKSMSVLNNGRFMQTMQSFTKSTAKNSLSLKSIFPFASMPLPGNGKDDGSQQLPDPNADMQVIQVGESCDDAMASIANYYKAAAAGLQTAATQMVNTLNDSEMQSKLPAGVSKLNASESYAGGYSVELAQFQKNLDSESTQGMTMSGKVQMMAGANDRHVIFETNASNINIAMNSEQVSGSLKMSAAGKMVGDLTQKSIQSQSKLNASINIACENRSEGFVTIGGDLSQDSMITGGNIPKVSDKMLVNVDAKSTCADSQGSAVLKIGADFTAEQTDANNMKVSIALDMTDTDENNKKNSFEFVMTRDNMGTCTVSVAKMNGQPIANSNSNGRGGVRR